MAAGPHGDEGGDAGIPAVAAMPANAVGPPAPLAHTTIHTGGRLRPCAVFARDGLAPGTTLDRAGHRRRSHQHDRGRAGLASGRAGRRRAAAHPRRRVAGRRRVATEPSPLQLEIFNNLFMSCAEQMGAMLANTARSVNVKERLDFSCAIFDDQGRLIANAPHLPVHLGSMGEVVRAVLARHGGALDRRRRRPRQLALPRRHAPSRPHGGGAGLGRRRP